MKIGIIGTGRIGKLHAEILRSQRIECVAYDPFPQKDWAKSHGIHYTAHLEQLFQQPIDAVIIASPSDQHLDHIELALNHQKHIFCEKPIGLDLQSIQSTLKKVKDSGLTLQIGFNRRFDRHFAELKKTMQESMGQPHVIKITSRDPHCPPATYLKTSGGIFLDMSIHDLDMARFLANSDVLKIKAMGSCLIDPQIAAFNDIDTAIIHLVFKNGVLCVIENCRQAVYGYDQRIEVYHHECTLMADNPRTSSMVHYNQEGSHHAPLHTFFLDRYKQAYQDQMKAFISAIQHKQPVPVTGLDGYEAVKLSYAAQASMNQSQWIHL